MNQMKADISEIKYTVEQIKSTMKTLKNRMNGAEERTSELDNISCQQKETVKKLEAEQGQTKKKKKVSKN